MYWLRIGQKPLLGTLGSNIPHIFELAARLGEA